MKFPIAWITNRGCEYFGEVAKDGIDYHVEFYTKDGVGPYNCILGRCIDCAGEWIQPGYFGTIHKLFNNEIGAEIDNYENAVKELTISCNIFIL